MLKWTLVVTAILFGHQFFAQPSSAAWKERPAINAQGHEAYQKAMSAHQNFTMEMDAAADIGEIIDKKYADKCENFAGNGEVNKWGLIVERELTKEGQKALYAAPSDLKRICPAYATTKMNDDDRKGLWILIITAMTHYESSCDITESAKGPNGTAAGLLQLHRGHEASYSNGCRNGDSATAERSLICGISMLNDQVERGEPLFSAHSYWEVLRPQGRSKKARLIEAVIRQYPACKSAPMATIKTSPFKAKVRVGKKRK